MVASIILLVLVPTIYTFYRFADNQNERISSDQIFSFGREVVNTGELVYYQGSPSRITLTQSLPDNVESMEILTDWTTDPRINEFVIAHRVGEVVNDHAFPSQINMVGSFDAADVTPGVKNARIQAMVTPNRFPFVIISMNDECVISTNLDPSGNGADIDSTDTNHCGGPGCQGDYDNCNECDYNGDCQITQKDVEIIQSLEGR